MPTEESKKIKFTIVGTGQIACLTAALLAKRNRELPEEKRIEISILGRSEDSKSYQYLRDYGINIHFTNPEEDLHIDPSEFKNITTNVEDLGEQDHVLVATKVYEYNLGFFDNLNPLKKTRCQKGEETTIVLAQNGIPCWFPEAVDYVDPSNRILEVIGKDNVVGCVLNVACSVSEDNDKIIYNVNTPKEKIGFPIGRPDRNGNVANVKELINILSGVGLKPAVIDGGIAHEVLLKNQVNVVVSALTTLYDCDIGELLDNQDLNRVVGKLSSEVSSVATKVDSDFKLRNETRLYHRLDPSRNHTTSMKRDFDLGKPVEISIYQSLINLGKIKSPRIERTSCIKELKSILEEAVSHRDSFNKENPGNPENGAKAARQSVSKRLQEFIAYANYSYRPPTPPRSRSRSPEGEVVSSSRRGSVNSDEKGTDPGNEYVSKMSGFGSEPSSQVNSRRGSRNIPSKKSVVDGVNISESTVFSLKGLQVPLDQESSAKFQDSVSPISGSGPDSTRNSMADAVDTNEEDHPIQDSHRPDAVMRSRSSPGVDSSDDSISIASKMRRRRISETGDTVEQESVKAQKVVVSTNKQKTN